MKRWLIAMLVAAPGIAAAQALLDLKRDLAFDARTVDAQAERAYHARVQALAAAAGRLDQDPVLLARIEALVARLKPAAVYELPSAASIAWEIHTCRLCNENAAAMAGGRLLVGEEFVASLALTDDELGYVLAHEMVHVLAEHTREFASTARYFLGNGRNRNFADIQNELAESIGANLRMAPVYRQQELEADFGGFVIGARAGLDPDAMLTMLGKLQAEKVSSFLPSVSPAERIERARAMLSAARRIREIGIPAR